MKSIIIYSTSTCPYCKMEKAFLTEKGIAFSDVDVSADRAKQDEMIQKSGQMGVPVTVVADEHGKEDVVIGFDRARLLQLVGITD